MPMPTDITTDSFKIDNDVYQLDASRSKVRTVTDGMELLEISPGKLIQLIYDHIDWKILNVNGHLDDTLPSEYVMFGIQQDKFYFFINTKNHEDWYWYFFDTYMAVNSEAYDDENDGKMFVTFMCEIVHKMDINKFTFSNFYAMFSDICDMYFYESKASLTELDLFRYVTEYLTMNNLYTETAGLCVTPKITPTTL